VLVIWLASAGWAFTFGVCTQAATLWLAGVGLGDTAIGLNTGAYYLGIAVAAPLVPWLMRRWRTRCVVAGLALFGGTVALFPWGGGPAAWLFIRLLQGVGGALSLIPLEAYLSQASRPEHSSRNFGWYAVALTLAGALGIDAGLHLYQAGSAWPFLLAGSSALTAGLLIFVALPSPAEGPQQRPDHAPLRLSRNFLSYGTAWAQGFLEGGLLAFLSLYLLSLGLTQESAGNMMGATMAGVVLFQVPVAWLADRMGKTTVLLGCYAVVLIGQAVVPLCGPGPALAVWLFLVGGCCGAFYPLGLALLGDRLPAHHLARAYAWYMTMECLGSILGPVCMGQSRAWGGERAMFLAGQGALLLVLLAWLGARLRYNAGAWRQELRIRGQASDVSEQHKPAA
jgi:MFS family permease